MRSILWIICGLGLLIGFVTSASAQKDQTVRGYYCGYSEGDGGYLSMKVGGVEKTYVSYPDEPRVRYKGVKDGDPYKLPVGAELVLKFVMKKKYRKPEALLREVLFTGKINRRVKACSDF